MPSGVRTALAAALLAGPAVLAFFSGGFFDEPRLWAGIVAWVGVAVVALIAPRPMPRTRAGLLCVAGLTALAAWTAVSIAWAPVRDPALGDAERLALYAAFLICAAALLRGPSLWRAAGPALAGGAFVVCGYALGTRLLPGVVEAEQGVRAGDRLDQPLTYWNALGALAAMGLILVLGIASDATRTRGVRAAAAAPTPAFALTLYLTLSRGAFAAVAVGAVALVALVPERRTLESLAIAAIGGGAAALAAVFPGLDSVRDARPDEGAGLAVLGVVVLLTVLTGAMQWWRAGPDAASAGLPRLRPLAAAATLVLAVAAIALTVTANEDVDGGGERVDTPRGPERLQTLTTNRREYWQVALESVEDDPLRGTGARGFATLWLERRDIPETTQDAHSLYLETASELGIVGVLLLVCFLAGAAGAAIAARRNEAAHADTAAWSAAGIVFLVHAAFDWDWEMPAVALMFLALVGAAVAASEVTPTSSQPDG